MTLRRALVALALLVTLVAPDIASGAEARPSPAPDPAPTPAVAPPAAPAPVPAAPAEQTPPPLFADGFEATGNLAQWADESLIEVQQREVAAGLYAARATTDGEPRFATKRLDAEAADVYYRVRVNLLSQGGNPVTLLRLRTTRNDPILSLYVESDGRLAYFNDVASEPVVSSTPIRRGTWHDIQVHARIDPAGGATEVWLDELPVPALTRSAWLGTIPVGRIDLGDNSAGRTYDVAFDDVAVQTVYVPRNQVPGPVPGALEVQTIPALPGIPFVLDGQTWVTDADGFVRIEVAGWSLDLKQRIEIPPAILPDGAEARFARWINWSNTLNDDVTAALQVAFPITYSFVDLQGNPVDPALVQSLTFKSSIGVNHVFERAHHGQSQLVRGSRVVPTQVGPTNKEIYYTLENVMVNGTNVVNRAQQRYFPAQERVWTIQLRFFFARFSARDAFFGFPVGSAVKLVFPDGRAEEFPFGPGAETTLGPLPRGEYRVSAIGPGFSPPSPIVLSRDQVVDLKIITHLDMAVAASVLAAVGFGLLFLGRPQLVLVPLRLVLHPSRLVALIASVGRRRRPRPEVA